MAIVAGAALFLAVLFAAGYQLGSRKTADEEWRAVPPVQNAGPAAAEPGKKVGRLEDLLPALEAKVAADPGNVEQRVLLARTYTELGQRDKGVSALRALRKEAPQNTEVAILLATALAEGSSQNELREAYRVYDEAVRLKPAVAPMARLYQGEVLVKLGDSKGAVRLWKDYVRTLPADDQRRALFEQRIAAAPAG
jgi:cytochrome c-type biogenesis protein CcmH/NrfG